MKKKRLGLAAVIVVFALVIVWAAALLSKTNGQKQQELIRQAELLLNDEIYLRAQPLLEEAISYTDQQTAYAEELLKRVYIALIDEQGYATKYTDLLDTQMSRDTATAAVFMEAAQYYQKKGKIAKSIAVLRDGAEKTMDSAVIDEYERVRYQYRDGRVAFSQIMEAYNGMRQVETDGKWGLTDLSGEIMIPCEYEKVSTYSNALALVKKDDLIYSVDAQNHRMYVLPEGSQAGGVGLRQQVTDFGNYANDRVPLYRNGIWQRATGTFELGSMSFEAFGMYTDGYAAAKTGTKWGVIDLSDTWMLPAEYDAVMMDELGRCYGQGCVFAKKNGTVTLFADGQLLPGKYDDAQPFQEDGYAAVQMNGKWGFVDTAGVMQIDCQFDEARSFHQGLAAVRIGERWGYIKLDGEIAIEPVFYNAKSFCDGYAPVETENGWTIIQLYEYED